MLEGGRVVGSKSRSGIGGDNNGLRVIRSRVKRNMALNEQIMVRKEWNPYGIERA